jgi:hypothetical protein
MIGFLRGVKVGRERRSLLAAHHIAEWLPWALQL